MKIQLETGNVLEFPDDAADAEIQAGITDFLGSAPTPEKGFMQSMGDMVAPPTQAEAGENLDQYKAGLVNAASFATGGMNDEMMARITAAGTYPVTGAIAAANSMGADIPNPMAGKSWDEMVDAETMRNRAQNKEAMNGASLTTQIVSGGIGTALNPASRLFPSSMAAQGTTVGGLQGFGEGEDGFGNRLASALPQAVIGGALGAAGDVAMKAGSAGLNWLGKKVNPPAALEKITEYRKKAYKYIEDSDFEINPEDMTKMGQRIAARVLPKKAQELELLKANNPAVIAKLGQFEKTMSATPTSLKATRMYDAGLNDAITDSIKLGNKSTTDTKYLYDLQDEFRAAIDDAAEGLPPAARDANFLNTQERKITDVYRILENASYTQNPATHVQTQFKRILDKGRGWSEQDKAVIRLILKEDLGDETLRAIGSRLSSIGQLAQGNIGTSLLQTGFSAMARNAKDARKLAKVDRLVTQIGRESAKRIKQMEYINAPKPAPAQPKPEPQKLLPAPAIRLPAPAIRLPDEVGKPTLDTMIPKQKLLAAPALENVTSKTGQVRPQTAAERDAAIAMRQQYQKTGRGEALRAQEPPIQNFPDPRVPKATEFPDSPEKAIIDQAYAIRNSLKDTFRGDVDKEVIKQLGFKPRSLSQLVVDEGGIKKVGELRDAGLSNRSMVGLIRNKGQQLDFLKQAAHERGYFPNARNYDDISDSEFFDAIVQDRQGKKVYSFEDQVRMDEIAQKLMPDQELERLGIRSDMTVKEIADILLEAEGSPPLKITIRPNLKTKIKKKD